MAILERRLEIVDRSAAILEKRAETHLSYLISQFKEVVTTLVIGSPDKKMEDGMLTVTFRDGTKTIRLGIPRETGELIPFPRPSREEHLTNTSIIDFPETPKSEDNENVIFFPLDMIDDPPRPYDRVISVTVDDLDKGKITYNDRKNVFPIRSAVALDNATIRMPTYTFMLSPQKAILYREEITRQNANLPLISQENVSRLGLTSDNALTVQERALQRYKDVMKILLARVNKDEVPAPNNIRTFRKPRK